MESKAFVITGISRGLGKALFNTLHSNFTNNIIIGIGRNFTADQQAAAKSYPKKIKLINIDLSESFDLAKIPELFDTDIQKIYLILNAGVVHPIKFSGNIDHSDFISSLTVNFISHVRLCHHFLFNNRHQKKQVCILNISTGATLYPRAGWSAYCSSKAAMRMYLDCLSKEYKFVQVMHIDPGTLDTDMQNEIRNAQPKDFPEVNKFSELKRNNQLLDPAQAAINILKETNIL